MSDSQPPGHRLLDYPRLAGRLRVSTVVLAMIAFAGAVVEGLADGLSFAVIGRWAGLFVVSAMLVAAVLVAAHAYRGADRAQRGGERLSGDDVGLLPPRRPRD